MERLLPDPRQSAVGPPTVRIGIDLVDVDQVGAAIRSHGERYLRRVYTQAEVRDCGGYASPQPERLAARFAAKEAAFKALRAPALPFHEIEVVRRGDGSPRLALHGSLATHAAGIGATGVELSLAHEAGIAAAIVAVTTSQGGAPDDR